MEEVLERYFRSINTHDEKLHAELFSRDVAFFGSASGIRDHGIATLIGVWRGARNTFK